MLRIARTDAEKSYRDLSEHRITITYESDGWHVDYEVKDELRTRGGGPHYIIDPVTGIILTKRFEQ